MEYLPPSTFALPVRVSPSILPFRSSSLAPLPCSPEHKAFMGQEAAAQIMLLQLLLYYGEHLRAAEVRQIGNGTSKDEEQSTAVP